MFLREDGKVMKGRLHSVETFGAVDGPGIRTVFFMQGCPARCLYCHNPDTWDICGGQETELDEILHRGMRGKPYYGKDGGVTFSGGEPLMQGKFVLKAMELLKRNDIKSVIDTSGTYIDDYTEDIVKGAQLMLLDIKHSDPKEFERISGCRQDKLFEIIELAKKHSTPLWVRQVIVPGINDSEENIESLGAFIKEYIGDDLYKAELLGYHTMAVNKYKKLGMKYRLDGVEQMDKGRLEQLSCKLIQVLGI